MKTIIKKNTHQKERAKVKMKNLDGKTCVENNNLRLACAMEYQDEISRLTHYIQGSKNVQRVQVIAASNIMKEIKNVLVKMGADKKLMKALNNSTLFGITLKPYQDKLLKIRGEIDEVCQDK